MTRSEEIQHWATVLRRHKVWMEQHHYPVPRWFTDIYLSLVLHGTLPDGNERRRLEMMQMRPYAIDDVRTQQDAIGSDGRYRYDGYLELECTECHTTTLVEKGGHLLCSLCEELQELQMKHQRELERYLASRWTARARRRLAAVPIIPVVPVIFIALWTIILIIIVAMGK